MEPVGQQRRMAREKAGRSVPLSRFPSMLQTSRLALPGAFTKVKASGGRYSCRSIHLPPYVVGYIRRPKVSKPVPGALRPTGSARSSQTRSKPVKVISTVIFFNRMTPIRPNPAESDRRKRQSHGKWDCCEHSRAKTSHARREGLFHRSASSPRLTWQASSATFGGPRRRSNRTELHGYPVRSDLIRLDPTNPDENPTSLYCKCTIPPRLKWEIEAQRRRRFVLQRTWAHAAAAVALTARVPFTILLPFRGGHDDGDH